MKGLTHRKFFALLLWLSLFGFFVGCYDVADDTSSTSVELELTQEGTLQPAGGVQAHFSESNGIAYTSNGIINVPLEYAITVNFGASVDPSSITSSTVYILRNDTGEVLSSDLACNNGYVTVDPIQQLKIKSDGKGVYSIGFKQDTEYTLVLSLSDIYDVNGNRYGSSSYYYDIATVELDFGIYFIGKNGMMEKATVANNPYYDPSRPTMFYVHGWQTGVCSDDFGLESPFYFASKYISAYDAAADWIDAGYNVAVFYWSQFADEDEVKDAQAKLYKADNDRKDMRYQIRNKQFKYYSTDKNMTELALDCYTEAFSGYYGSSIRVVGHSLGNQLATTLSHAISEAYYNGEISSSLVPDRLVLLDPFWGKGSENCVNGRWVGEVCRAYVDTLISRHDIALEQYKSSALGGAVADENLDMRKKSAFFRIWPDFISIWDQTDQHWYAYNWYVLSINDEIYGNYSARFGAAASNADIKNLMNYGKNTPYFWYSSSGKNSPDPTDDYFKRKRGVNTW